MQQLILLKCLSVRLGNHELNLQNESKYMKVRKIFFKNFFVNKIKSKVKHNKQI